VRFWVDGAVVGSEHARVDVLDHGLTVGDGVFETLKTVPDAAGSARPFAMDRHIARLAASAVGIGLPAPDSGVVAGALMAVCDANQELADGGRLRVTLTSGPGPLGSERGPGGSTLVVAATPATSWPETTTLARSPWPRNERSPVAGLKTTSYIENILMLAHARGLGAGEALLVNLAGDLCEGTGSNIFVILDGQIVTPPLSSGCLAGITRGLVVEWCAAASIDLVERDVSIRGVESAEEVFLTSSTRDVHPVTRILGSSGEEIWVGSVGPLTRIVAALFSERAAADWNP
jgi:branched-chain amino acid aminotransferase